MKKLLSTAILAVFSLSLSAQIYNESMRDIQNVMDRNSTVNEKESIQAEGSPYTQKEFQPVKLNGLTANISAKYNAYVGQIHIKVDEKLVSLNVSGDYEVNFLVDNKTYKTFTYTTLTKLTKRGFLVVVEDTEDFKLLKEEIIIYKDKVPAKNTYIREEPAKFIRESDVYYFMLNDEAVHFPTKKKALIKAFPKNSKKIKSYIKTNKLSTKNEEDLVKIAAYIASISDNTKDDNEKKSEVEETKEDEEN
jgi:hypothetical protein